MFGLCMNRMLFGHELLDRVYIMNQHNSGSVFLDSNDLKLTVYHALK